MRLTPFDVLLVGIVIYFIVRMALRNRGGGRGPSGGTRPPAPRQPKAPEAPENGDPRREAVEAYQRAQRAWDMLRSDETKRTPARAKDGGFDEREFLEGAKAMCARIRQSWDARDLEDLAQFSTPSAMAEFERRAASETRSARSQPLLIEAGLVERTKRDDGMEEASVLYKILEKTPGGGENRESREMWNFVRRADVPGDMWRLDAMRTVDDAGARPQ